MTERRPPNDEDARLCLMVLRCQAGDESAFAQLLHLFGGRTLAHLRTLVGDAADDVQQEVWLTVFRRIRTVSNPRAFRTWLYRATRHRAIDYLRARKREREIFEDVEEKTDWASAPEERPLDLAGASVAAVFDRLAPAHREALRLRYEDDLGYTEMALVLGCAIGTVRSRLHNAKRQLQALMEGRT
jgi:RNA polymerase sigma-70 factor (ECF subfamily)